MTRNTRSGRFERMEKSDRLVMVSGRALEDLCDLADRACGDLDVVLGNALRGAVAEVRAHALLEPV